MDPVKSPHIFFYLWPLGVQGENLAPLANFTSDKGTILAPIRLKTTRFLAGV